MKKLSVKWLGLLFLFAALIISCSMSGTQLTDSILSEEYSGGPVSDILVIAVTGNEKSRQQFEKTFVAHLNAAGLEAISSIEVIPMPPDLKMEKEEILKTVEKFKNDSVIVTHLIAYDEKDVHTRDGVSRRPHYGYYGYYNYLHNYHTDPGYSSTNRTVRLETNLYDVKTESLIWTGKSTTWDAESKTQVRNDVIRVVINDLKLNNLIAPKKTE